MEFKSAIGKKFIRYNLLLFVIPALIIFVSFYIRDIGIEKVFAAYLLIGIIVCFNLFKPIKYVLGQHQLIIYNGFIKTKIFYDAITEISETDKIIVGGNKAAKSEDAIEISYRGGSMYDQAKISPKNKSKFLTELRRRAVKAKFLI